MTSAEKFAYVDTLTGWHWWVFSGAIIPAIAGAVLGLLMLGFAAEWFVAFLRRRNTSIDEWKTDV